MLSKTLHYICNDRQYPNLKDEKNMGTRQSYNIFLAHLIRDNCEHKNGYYKLQVSDLTTSDKNLFLSYLIDIDDITWVAENGQTYTDGIRLAQLVREHTKEMQYEIDSHIDEIYREDMEEMGLHFCRHKDNGEGFWIK